MSKSKPAAAEPEPAKARLPQGFFLSSATITPRTASSATPGPQGKHRKKRRKPPSYISGDRVKILVPPYEGEFGTLEKVLPSKKNKWGLQLDSGKRVALMPTSFRRLRPVKKKKRRRVKRKKIEVSTVDLTVEKARPKKKRRVEVEKIKGVG